ncbi:MAG: glycoside hydrolase family 10 protein [Candidatus Gastranaerophilaceae bacterium]
MKIKHILSLMTALILSVASCQAEDGAVNVSQTLSNTQPILTAKAKPKEDLPVIIQPPCNLSADEIEYKAIPPAFRPYQPSKDEVVFSHTKAWINAVDPTAATNRAGGYLPGARGVNQLVIYTPAYGIRTNTNEFGAEAVVEGNTVTELSGADSFIPPNGVVLSGHGSAKTWMNQSVKVGTKIYIDQAANIVYTYTTSASYIFESEKKIAEAQQMIDFYRASVPDYNWRVPNSYINDAKDYLKKAQKNPDEVQKYSKLAIEAANDALKSVIPYKSSELKGVWLRPTEKTEADIINTLNRIKKAGINDIFLESYFHGKTIFPSETMKAYGFTPQYEQFSGIDPLAIWVKEAHKRNIKVHIWFETFYVGTQNPKDNPQSILARNPSWANKTKKDTDSIEATKSTSEHNGYFLDPANPQVQDFLVKLIDEIITRYKPDGINLDYIRYPNSVAVNETSSWGYTPVAREEFKQMYGVDPVDISIKDPLWPVWCGYRRMKVTNMVQKVGKLGKQKNTYITAVIFPDRQAALDKKQQDWKTWSQNNYLNGFTPLFLTCDSKMANSMMQDVLKAKGPSTDFYAGLFVTFMSGSEEDLIRQIHEARKLNANGVIIFDYAHLSDKYVNALSTSVFAPHYTFKNLPQNKDNQPQQKTKTKKKRWWNKK